MNAYFALHGHGQAPSWAGTHPVQSPNLSCRETTPRRGQSGRKNMSRAPHLEHLKRRLSPCKDASPKRSSRGATATIRWWLHFSHQTHKSSLRTASHDRRAGSRATLSSSFSRSSPNTQHKLSNATIQEQNRNTLRVDGPGVKPSPPPVFGGPLRLRA